MVFGYNPGFLTLALIEGFAVLILFVLYAQLFSSFSERFFKLWLAGWSVYLALDTVRIVSIWRGGPSDPFAVRMLSVAMAGAVFTAALEYGGFARGLKYFWAWVLIAIAGLVALGPVAKLVTAERWSESILQCLLYVFAGYIFWRAQSPYRGISSKVLAVALIIRGFQGAGHPLWLEGRMALLRYTSEALLGVAMGIAMAVLILESGRVRTANLNERLRRLALITAEASQSFRVDDALDSVLHHLVESLAATHGLVFLLDDSSEPPPLVLRASVGFSNRYLRQYATVSSSEDWVARILSQQAPMTFSPSTANAAVAGWMFAENLGSVAFINVPGKEGPLGLLAIGSSVPRRFQSDEETFLVNVANLLGLTIQNVGLFENATASRKQWRDTFDSIDDLILVHSNDGRVLRANRAFTARLGIEPAALIGRYVSELLRKGNTEWIRCPYCEGVAGRGDDPDPTFGGYFLATDSAFQDSQAASTGTVHVLKDVTSRRQAESKYRNLFEKVQEGIFISTPQGRFLDFNGAFMRILGYESRELLLECESVKEFYVNPPDRERLKRLLHEYGEVSDFEFQFRRRDGEIRTAHESSFATRDDSGAIVAYQGFLLDVTEQKRAEMDIRRRNRELLALNNIAELLNQCSTLGEGLKEALERVTKLFLVDVAGVYFLDEGTKILKPSAQVGFESEFGLRAEPIEVPEALLNQLQQSRATLLSGSAPVLPPGFRRLQMEEGIGVSQVVMLWTKDRIMGALLVGSRGARDFATADLNLLEALGNQIATTIDKSLLLEKTRAAYETLRLTQEQLLQSEKMAAVGQLISGVAHELNNPLTAILGYSQLLQADPSTSARGADYVAKLHKQAHRTHHIVQSLLSFARQHKPERGSIHMNEIIEDTLLLRENDLRRNNITVHRDFAADLPAIAGDFHQMQQVVLNILNNSVDAINETSSGGEIWIRTQNAGNALQIEFTDSGRGLKDPKRIFDPFYTTKAVGKGTGLGLSICYGIVKEHGGEIRARNTESGSACFTIVLPFSPFPHKLKTDAPLQSAKSVAGTILVVDDDEAVLQIEHEILVSHGVRVRKARSAWEALGILKSDSVDAAVVDLKLPGDVSAEGLYAWVEQHRPDLTARLIFTSSSVTEPGPASLVGRAAAPILTKPFKIEDFWSAVHKALSTEVLAGHRR